MAKILFSALVDGVRGRAGGVIFSANASGPMVKRYAPPIIKSTPAQTNRRAIFSQWGAAWAGLTAGQRSDWRTYAAAAPQEKTDSLGNPYYLNGFQWFVSCNSNRNLTARGQLSAAPVIAVPTAPTIGALTITAPGVAGCTQAFTVASFGTNDLVIEMNWTKGNSRLIATEKNFLFVDGVQNAALATPLNLGDISAIFGTITAGSYWISRVFAQTSEGRRSTYVSANTVAI